MTELAQTMSDAHWGQTLAAFGQREWSGTLTVVAEDRTFSMLLDRGAVVDASSPLATDAAVRVALLGQLISSTKVSEIVRHHAGAPNRNELDVIVELGKLSAEQAIQLRRRVVARRAARTFSLANGALHADEATATAVAPPFSQLDVREVIFLGARENLAAHLLDTEIQRNGSWFILEPRQAATLPRFGFGDDAVPIIDLLREGASVAELEACKPGIDRRLVWSVLYALLTCKAAVADDAARAIRRDRDREADLVAPRAVKPVAPADAGELAPRPRRPRVDGEGGELAPVAPVRKLAPARPAISDLVGVTIGDRYVVEQKLGVGSTGVVYRAHHTKLTRLFALKILHRGLLADDKAVRRFEREAQIAGALAHPNVVSVVDVGTTDGVPYLAMEHADGASLATLILEGPMRPARVIDLLRQLCLGLAHAHERGIIHRDLKPENVIVEAVGDLETPRIADFALARLREPGDNDRLTAAGVVLGTPAYMAPEQAIGGAMDHRVDLYALGVIAYQMLTGVLPFAGSNVEIARASFRDPPPVMGTRVPGLVVDPLLEALARVLLEKSPDARPRDADEVRKIVDLIESDRDTAAARLGVVLGDPKHPATIAMWKLSRDSDTPPPEVMPPPPPARAPMKTLPPPEPIAPAPATVHGMPPLTPPAPPAVPAPIVQIARARYDGSGTVSSILRTEAMEPIKAKPRWPLIAVVAAIVLVIIVVLALQVF